jgi:hypothetical protein
MTVIPSPARISTLPKFLADTGQVLGKISGQLSTSVATSADQFLTNYYAMKRELSE